MVTNKWLKFQIDCSNGSWVILSKRNPRWRPGGHIGFPISAKFGRTHPRIATSTWSKFHLCGSKGLWNNKSLEIAFSPVVDTQKRMPGGHIGSNRNTISNALTPHKVQTLWQVWSNSCNNYLVKPLFTGREICILTGWGDTFTLAWRPYWIQSKNYFMCIDTLKGANTMAGLIKVIQQLPGKTFVSRSGNLHFHQLWRHVYACLAAILDPIEIPFLVH